MAWSKKFTEDEDEFVRQHFGRITIADIARSLNRSERAIYYAVNRLGLREPHARASCRAGGQDEPATAQEATSRLEDLLFVKKSLRLSMAEAGPKDMARLAHEYRETIEEIERIQNGGDEPGGEADNPLGDVFALVPLGR